MPFKVLTRTMSGWDDCWMLDDKPQRFATYEAAEAEVTELIDDVRLAVEIGEMDDEYSRDDYKIVEVSDGE